MGVVEWLIFIISASLLKVKGWKGERVKKMANAFKRRKSEKVKR